MYNIAMLLTEIDPMVEAPINVDNSMLEYLSKEFAHEPADDKAAKALASRRRSISDAGSCGSDPRTSLGSDHGDGFSDHGSSSGSMTGGGGSGGGVGGGGAGDGSVSGSMRPAARRRSSVESVKQLSLIMTKSQYDLSLHFADSDDDASPAATSSSSTEKKAPEAARGGGGDDGGASLARAAGLIGDGRQDAEDHSCSDGSEDEGWGGSNASHASLPLSLLSSPRSASSSFSSSNSSSSLPGSSSGAVTTCATSLSALSAAAVAARQAEDKRRRSAEEAAVAATQAAESTFETLSLCFNDWNFDIFEAFEVSPCPLVKVGFVCLDAFSHTIELNRVKMFSFLSDIEASYRDVPYHNRRHGAAVGRAVFSFCKQDRGLDGCLSDVAQFALVLAGLVHDVNHPGVTSTFLLRASLDHLSDFNQDGQTTASKRKSSNIRKSNRNSSVLSAASPNSSSSSSSSPGRVSGRTSTTGGSGRGRGSGTRSMSLCSDGGVEALALADKQRGERRRLLSKNISLGYISPPVKHHARSLSASSAVSYRSMDSGSSSLQGENGSVCGSVNGGGSISGSMGGGSFDESSRWSGKGGESKSPKSPSSSKTIRFSLDGDDGGVKGVVVERKVYSGGVSDVPGILAVEEENDFSSDDDEDDHGHHDGHGGQGEDGGEEEGEGEEGPEYDDYEDMMFSPFDRELAVRYNDQSPLEHMHLAITFSLLRREENNFLSQEMLANIRSLLVKAILGTDMANHSEQMARLDALIENVRAEDEGNTGAIPWYWPIKPPPSLKTPNEKKVWAANLQEGFVVELFLHAADIGSPAMPFTQFRKWNRLCQEEFFVQGEMEVVEFGHLISPAAGFDRSQPSIAEHNFSNFFINFLSKPLFEKLNELSQIGLHSNDADGDDDGDESMPPSAALLSKTIGGGDNAVSSEFKSFEQVEEDEVSTNLIRGVDLAKHLANLKFNSAEWLRIGNELKLNPTAARTATPPPQDQPQAQPHAETQVPLPTTTTPGSMNDTVSPSSSVSGDSSMKSSMKKIPSSPQSTPPFKPTNMPPPLPLNDDDDNEPASASSSPLSSSSSLTSSPSIVVKKSVVSPSTRSVKSMFKSVHED